MHINIYPLIPELWQNHPTYKNSKKNNDVGLDIPMDKMEVPPGARGFKLNLGIKTSPSDGYMLIPRSSISKTPLRLSNSVGIIDKKYRGILMATVDNLSNERVIIDKNTCLFQVVSFDGILPTFSIIKETELDNTTRGTGGFGSTGHTLNI